MKYFKNLKKKLINKYYKAKVYTKNEKLNKNFKVHFVGICGVSMSSLAIYAKNKGYIVSGSDLNLNSENVQELANANINLYHNHSANNILDKQLVIYSNATENCEEVQAAKVNNIKTMSRAEFLNEMLKEYETNICISGAHGKTTTTSLIFAILKQANYCPSLHLGGIYKETGRAYEYNKKEYMVCEACEYKDSFLALEPQIGVILNVAPEHLDYFKNFENIKESFKKFAKKSKIVIVNSNLALQGENIITFGIKEGTFTAKKIKLNKDGKYMFKCYKNNEFYLDVYLNLIGKHNILNALASIAVADYLNVNKKDMSIALNEFCGVERRYEFLHKTKFIVHDYAHHPDEINAILNETKKINKSKLLVVFQPHTYSRTKSLMQEFVKCFKKIKNLVILKTYSAREEFDESGSACLLANKIGKTAVYIEENANAEKYILEKIEQNYAVIFLGAGDIYALAKNVSKMC